jgi:hypothetical protein
VISTKNTAGVSDAEIVAAIPPKENKYLLGSVELSREM